MLICPIPYDPLWAERGRAQSYGEDYNRRVYRKQNSSSASSGYASCASSNHSSIAHVEVYGRSNESLSGSSGSPSPYPLAYSDRTSRGGSLKAYMHHSTTRGHANHAKLRDSHKSLDQLTLRFIVATVNLINQLAIANYNCVFFLIYFKQITKDVHTSLYIIVTSIMLIFKKSLTSLRLSFTASIIICLFSSILFITHKHELDRLQ